MDFSTPIIAQADHLAAIRATLLAQAETIAFDRPTASHDAHWLTAQAEGFAMIERLEQLIDKAAAIPTYAFEGDDVDDYVLNSAYVAAWDEVEAFAIVAARTNALSIIKAQERYDYLGLLVIEGADRWSQWMALPTQEHDALVQNHVLGIPAPTPARYN